MRCGGGGTGCRSLNTCRSQDDDYTLRMWLSGLQYVLVDARLDHGDKKQQGYVSGSAGHQPHTQLNFVGTNGAYFRKKWGPSVRFVDDVGARA